MENDKNFSAIIDDCEYYDYLEHYGMPRRSGRYPWGSGEHPYQSTEDFLSQIDKLEKQGLTEKQIADSFGISTGKYRAQKSMAKKERRQLYVDYANSLRKDGLGASEIARKINEKYNANITESNVRSYWDAERNERMDRSFKAADTLMNLVDEKGMIDVGRSVEHDLGISRVKLDEALEIAQQYGYEVRYASVPQVNPNQRINYRVLCPPGTEKKEAYKAEDIHFVKDYGPISTDNGESFQPAFRYPKSMDSKRIQIRYAEDGGKNMDGVIQLRRGVKDLDLGPGVNYAQVRILVDNDHYLKGMAMYADDLPDGVDVRFNTNKSKDTPKMDVLKKIKNDPDNPFGSSIKERGGQSYYPDPNGEYEINGKKMSMSVINKAREEGDWSDWSKQVSAQFLSKQSPSLIKQQLKVSIDSKKDEYDQIMEINNPTVRKNRLESFADECDSNAVDLKAHPLPGERFQVILPVSSLPDNQCYAPNWKNGTTLALIRYPHAGTFEIPIVQVNNNNLEGKNNITASAKDVIGINSNVAQRLSGADFDGDTVMAIPVTDKTPIKSTPSLFDEPFDTGIYGGITKVDSNGNEHYYRGGVEYFPPSERDKQKKMGIASNLITDMTLQGATREELARAVRYSMVVIDATKHHLDDKAAYYDNNIGELQRKYQAHVDLNGNKKYGGAATLLSRAKGVQRVPERKEGAIVARDTGKVLDVLDERKKLYVDNETGEIYKREDRKVVLVDPKTGKKLWHNTNRIRKYVEYNVKEIDPETGKETNRKVKADVIEKDGKQYYRDERKPKILGSRGLMVHPYTEITNEKVKSVPVEIEVAQMELVDDANQLSTGKIQERIYAQYANNLKYMANEARKQAASTKDIQYSVSAAKTYADEVKSLDDKLIEAESNDPRERQANYIANAKIEAWKNDNPGYTKDELKKHHQRFLTQARNAVGAKRHSIYITDMEWEAIQAGAISPTKLRKILNKVDDERLTQLSTPLKNKEVLSSARITRMKTLSNAGFTNAEIADDMGVSVSTVIKYLSGKEDK